jgi:hypothetical protein
MQTLACIRAGCGIYRYLLDSWETHHRSHRNALPNFALATGNQYINVFPVVLRLLQSMSIPIRLNVPCLPDTLSFSMCHHVTFAVPILARALGQLYALTPSRSQRSMQVSSFSGACLVCFDACEPYVTMLHVNCLYIYIH